MLDEPRTRGSMQRALAKADRLGLIVADDRNQRSLLAANVTVADEGSR